MLIKDTEVYMFRKPCKKYKKRVFILILTFIAMAEFFFVHLNDCYAQDNKDKYDVKNIIDRCYASLGGDSGFILDGDILSAAGTTNGDWLAFGCGRYEKDDRYDIYLGALEDYVTSCYSKNSYGLDRNKATEWHRIALTVIACGGNPEAFGTDADGNPVNLIADGTYNCKIGNPWKQGINGAAYALIVLDSRKYIVPDNAEYTRQDCIDYIIENELAGGGFSLSKEEADADVTGIVLQALAPYYDTSQEVKAVVDRALERLSFMQFSSGDFASYGYGNAESTAQVITALTSLGIDVLEDKRFITDTGKTALDGLMLYFNEEKTGFCHISGYDTDIMATNQSLYSLISYYRYINGLGKLYDFTEKELDTKPVTPPSELQTPSETQTPSEFQTPPEIQTPSEAQTPFSGEQDPSEFIPQVPAESKLTADSDSKKNSHISNRRKKRPVKKVVTVTKIIKSKDISIKKKEACATKKELNRIAGTGHNLKIITETKEGIQYNVTFNGKDISEPSDMHFALTCKSKYENRITAVSDKPYIMSIETKKGLKCDAFIELAAGLKDGEYLLMRYDSKDEKPVFVNKIRSENGILRFVIDSGGEYFAAKKVKLNATYENNGIDYLSDTENTEEQIENISGGKITDAEANVFVPPKVYIAVLIFIAAAAFAAGVVIRRRRNR